MGQLESVAVQEVDVPIIFDWNHPVIRRGGSFNFTLKEEWFLNNMIAPEKVNIILDANGERVEDQQITYNDQKVSKSNWNLKYFKTTDERIKFLLETPNDCEPGEYEIIIMNGKKKLGSQKFLMLFNPWNPDDEVYIPQQEDRFEYVLNPKTIIYQGSSGSIMANAWSLDQFSLPAIEVLLNLLKRTHKHLRSSAPKLARELTALVNNLDDDGILVGRWDGEYSNGKPPHYWRGSKAIFEKYMKEKQPVKYGQCFTFAAVLCSVLRLVGIGCRIISCFDCLHDTDDTLDMEVYYDKDYNFLKYHTKDSIWNFHCWNECYMKCTEFDKYNGWHVCDATPQEVSIDGRYTLGPSPVAAVKAGDLKVGFDSRYVFSEVNGDVVYKRIIDGRKETFDVKISEIGHEISTKSVGSDTRRDITENYKYADGSLMDIMARKNADGTIIEIPHKIKIIDIRQVNNKDHILMGEDLDLIINLLVAYDSPIELLIKCLILQHPNIRSKDISHNKVTLEPNGKKSTSFKVSSKDILNKVQSDLCGVLVEVFVIEKEKMSLYSYKLTLKTPSFDLLIPEEVKVCQKSEIIVKMLNPMPFKLKNVSVRLEIDFTPTKHKKHYKEIKIGKTIKAKFDIVPNKRGFFEVRAVIYGPTIPTFHEVASINIV